MKGGFRICLMIVLSLAVTWSAGTDIPDDLRIITEEYPPLNYVENGSLQGISVDLMEKVLERMGTGINRSSFEMMPWYEGYNLTLNRPDTILFSTARFPERENLFLWAGPLISDRKVLFALTDPSRASHASVASMKIVAITNDSAIRYATDAGADPGNIILVSSVSDAVQMVENGSADAWAYGEIAGQRALNMVADDPSRFGGITDLGETTDYIAFSRGTPPAFVQAVNDTIKELKLDRAGTGTTTYEQLVARYLPVQCKDTGVSRDQIISLVSNTAADIENDADGTIAAINAGESPYRETTEPYRYVYVFDTGVVMIANPENPYLVGKNLSGTTDVYGKPFRDEMVSQAVKNGKGWIRYVYSNPDSLGIYHKMSYFQLVNGSDGTKYVTGAGRFTPCNEINDDQQGDIGFS